MDSHLQNFPDTKLSDPENFVSENLRQKVLNAGENLQQNVRLKSEVTAEELLLRSFTHK